MHPYYLSQLAAEHASELRAQATAARRARRVRRARRTWDTEAGSSRAPLPHAGLSARPV
jgi:hypothetical protein